LKVSKGKADPKLTQKLLEEKLGSRNVPKLPYVDTKLPYPALPILSKYWSGFS